MKILGYKYTIDQSKDMDSIGGAFGQFHARTQTIQLANDADLQQVQSTLLHEIIEAINYHLQLKLEHPQIMGLEAGLYQVLVDNGVNLSVLIE